MAEPKRAQYPTEAPPAPYAPYYPRYIDLPGEPRQCHCVNTFPDARGIINPPPLNCPNCHGTRVLKQQMIVNSPQHHSQVVGYEVGPDGERLRPKPPSIEEVMKAGYAKEAAESIAKDEAYKAMQGYEPYGDKPLPPANSAPAPVPFVSGLQVLCSHCGAALPKAMKFCGECGKSQTDSNIRIAVPEGMAAAAAPDPEF